MEQNQQQDVVSDLSSLFPNLDKEVIESVFRQNDMNFESSLNALLEMSDPTSKSNLPKTDEEIAQALQDQIMAEELQRELDQEASIQRTAVQNSDENVEEDDSFPLAEKLTNLGLATKKKFMEFYKKITNKEDTGSIALKNNDQDHLMSGFENEQADDDFLEENHSAKELSK